MLLALRPEQFNMSCSQKMIDRSKRFYETLGFEKLLDGEVAIFKARQFHSSTLLSKGLGWRTLGCSSWSTIWMPRGRTPLKG